MCDSIGSRILQLRKTLNLTQGAFAGHLGISQRHVSQIENESRKASEQLLMHICLRYNTSMFWLATGEGEMFLSPEEVIKGQIAHYGEWAFIKAFSRVLDEQGLVIPISTLGTRGQTNSDPVLSDMIDFLVDLWTVADDETKIWAKVQFARAFPEDIRDEVEKKLKGTEPNVTSS